MGKRFGTLLLTCLATTQVSGRWCELFDPSLQSTNPLVWTTGDSGPVRSKDEAPKTNPLAKTTPLPDNAGALKIVQLPL